MIDVVHCDNCVTQLFISICVPIGTKLFIDDAWEVSHYLRAPHVGVLK